MHVKWRTPANIGGPFAPTNPPLRLRSESGRPKAQPSTIRTARLRTAIIPRIVQAHLSRLRTLEACKTATELLLHANTRAITLESTDLIDVRVVDTCEACWARLELAPTATAADLDFVEYGLGCWSRELGGGDSAGGGFDSCGKDRLGRTCTDLRLLVGI